MVAITFACGNVSTLEPTDVPKAFACIREEMGMEWDGQLEMGVATSHHIIGAHAKAEQKGGGEPGHQSPEETVLD
jgi:hypothetical protein